MYRGGWKTDKKCVALEKSTPESVPGHPRPFRAKVEYSNQLKSYEKSEAFFFSLSCLPWGLNCVAFEKTHKKYVTPEKTHPWKRTWSPKAVSSQSRIFESTKKLREAESSFFEFSCLPGGLNCVAFEKIGKICVTVEKTQKSFETVEKTRGILAGVQADWGLNCVAFEKTNKRCVTVEKTHPWKCTWSPKAVSS